MSKGHGFCCMAGRSNNERFLEVSLLILIRDNPGHGYGLMDQLARFGFSGESLNMGSLYRALRKMEERGEVCSGWESGDSGPRRRIYRITEKGRQDLNFWIEHLKERKTRIEMLIEAYE